MIITGGKYKGRKIIAPDENITRPTLSKIRMGVFNTLYSVLTDFDNKTFLDVFGGSGIMGLEALSRGFKRVKVFEKNIKAAQIIKKNYNSLGLKPDLIIGDSNKLITKLQEDFDVIYVDPPYNQYESYENIIKFIKSGIILLEHTDNIDFSPFQIIKQKKYSEKYITYLKK